MTNWECKEYLLLKAAMINIFHITNGSDGYVYYEGDSDLSPTQPYGAN